MTDRPTRSLPGRWSGLGFLVAIATLAGCADYDEQSLCVSYAEYLVVADAVDRADPTAATAEDAADAVDLLLGEVAQLRAVADGRYREPLDRLESDLEDLERTLLALPEDADEATWLPLVEDTLDDVRIADDRVRRVIGPACAEQIGNDD